MFDAVQEKLAANATVRHKRPTLAAAALLKGRLFDVDGCPMSPSFGYGKSGRRFGYYVSTALQRGRRKDDGAVLRVSAPPLEALVVDRIDRLGGRVDHLRRVDLGTASIRLSLDADICRDRLSDRLPSGDEASMRAGVLEITIPKR